MFLVGRTARSARDVHVPPPLSEALMIQLPYGPNPQQYAELRIPDASAPFPVIVLIHGGCWIDYATAQYTAPLAEALTNKNWATWNLEYRRGHEEGGAWPGTFDDVVQGVDALREAAKNHPLDLDRVVVMGHSAGGQLALYAAARHRGRLRGVVSLAGIVDMRTYLDRGPQRCASGELRVMGGHYRDHPERYAQVSPAELLPLGTPQVLVWGGKDDIVPEALFADYQKRAREAGDRVQVIRITQADHHQLCSPEGPGWAQIVEALRSLLQPATSSIPATAPE